MDQRTCIKFCVKNEIKCADAFRMLTVAYGEATLDRSNVYRWYIMFSEGREDVNDEERAGRPSTSTTDEKINEVENMILANRRITVREVAEDLNISIGSCHSIFINDLGMRRVAAKFVPKMLNCDQKQHRMNIANEMLDSVRDDPNLLQRVITGDEAGVVHHEFLPQGRTVNKEYYLKVMRNLREAIRQKRPDLWKNKNWLLHHDNAPAHTSLLVRDSLAKNNTLMMPQPPYSPDLPPLSGRPHSATCETSINLAKASLEASRQKSTRRLSQELKIPRTSIQIMLKGLGYKPYIPKLIHALHEDDWDRRMEFCEKMLEMIQNDENLPNRIMWIDEAILKLNGRINRHNCVYWASKNLKV
ncbi:hypothetical protein LAZ67_20001160 [Cordylochernes scorpioides]|uniref:Mos1 transposase HTH domain-containing protein n=1 Tax=Cordylochernes scorpioides TaxID=51811 RepID=A0ABY6LM16_9ARAC|nr:hypothetical protein LAZ67_20001160 [Cordylochernes scorpioides]